MKLYQKLMCLFIFNLFVSNVFCFQNNLALYERRNLNREEKSGLKIFLTGILGSIIDNDEINPIDIESNLDTCIPEEWNKEKMEKQEKIIWKFFKSNVKKILHLRSLKVNIPGEGEYNNHKILEYVCFEKKEYYKIFDRDRRRRRNFRFYNTEKNRKNRKNERIDLNIFKEVEEAIKPVYSDFLNFINELRKKNFYRSLVEILSCTKLKLPHLGEIRVSRFLKSENLLSDNSKKNFPRIFLNLVCARDHLLRAIEDFSNAFVNVGLNRWKILGNFIGKFITAIGLLNDGLTGEHTNEKAEEKIESREKDKQIKKEEKETKNEDD